MTDITVTPNFQAKTPLTPEQRQQRTEQVATGVGGAAGLSSQAAKVARRGSINAGTIRNAETQLQHMMEQTQRTMNSVNNNAKAVNGLWSAFKHDIEFYTEDIIKRLESLKNAKFIGPILNSPITKKMAGAAGGALAFFVLITGVNKAVKTGAIAVDDFKNQYSEFKAYA